jgi:hypothetical protein
MRDKFIAGLLGVFLGAGAAMWIEGTPERQAKRDIARCAEIARIMMTPQNFDSQFLSKPSVSWPKLFEQRGPWSDYQDTIEQGYKISLYGLTLSCLLGKR